MTDEIEEYTSEFEDEADALNNAIAVFEEELETVARIRTEIECDIGGGAIVQLIWKQIGKQREWRIHLVEIPGEAPRLLKDAALALRVKLVEHFTSLTNAVRKREVEVIQQLKGARLVVAAATARIQTEKEKD